MKTTLFRVLCAVLFLLPALLFGQADVGGIRGTITDPSGGIVPGAAVSATHIGTAVVTRRESTAAGVYTITNLRAGDYRIEVEKAGFKKVVKEKVTIPVGVVYGLDFALEVGETNQTVDVTAQAPLLNTENVTLATSVNPSSYLDLPISASGSRSVESFINLAPGVNGGDSFSYNANGGQLFSRQIKIDGLDVSNVLAQPGDSGKVLTLPPDALQEFTYNTSNQSAEQGNNMSGSIIYIVKSGTNQLHGSGYWFNAQNFLQARNFFQADVARFNRNEYGGAIGGPVWIPHVYDGRNRTFWFFNYNKYDVRAAPQSNYITVPTAQEHTGDFSDYRDVNGNLIPIYDPLTTRPIPGGGFTRDPFPGNVIPATRISSVGALIASGIPSPPAGSGIVNNILQNTVSNQGFYNYTFKIDQHIGSRHSISFSFNRNVSNSYNCSNPCFDPNNVTGNSVVAGVQNAGGFAAKHYWGHLSYDLTIRPNLLFHITVGMDKYKQQDDPYSWDQGWQQVLGFPNLGTGRFPYVNFDNFYQPLSANQSKETYAGTVPQGSYNIGWIKGKHSLKFGGDSSWYTNTHVAPDFPATYFTPLETGLPGVTQTGNPFASMLLGLTDQGVRHVQAISTNAFYWSQALFAQDDIKWSPKLTINLGIRWEVYAPFYDKKNYHSIMDPTVPNPGCGGCLGALVFAGNGPGEAGVRRFNPPIDYKNFSPRVGLAYLLKQDLVLRAGYGITTIMPARAGSGGVRWADLGYTADATFLTPNNGVTPAFLLDRGFPQFQLPPFLTPDYANGSSVVTYDSNASRPPYLQQWNLNVQKRFGQDWLLDVGYVASKGTRLYTGTMNINQVDPQYLKYGALLTDPIEAPAVQAAGFQKPYPSFQGSLAQALRPFPQYLYVGSGGNEIRLLLLGGAQNGSSTYNSFQAKLEHQVGKGLWLLTSYTYQKWLTNAPTTAGGGAGTISSQGGFAGISARDNYHRSLEHALGPVPPQMFTVGFNYELPFGPGKKFGANTTGFGARIIGGWQFNGILRYYSGNPITVTVNNTLPIFNDINFPNIVPGVPQVLNSTITTPSGPGAQLYLNPAAFQEPAPYSYGNAPQTLNIRGFSNYNENLSVIKRINIYKENTYLEIRFEAFNVFNRHHWTGIASNLSSPDFGTITGVSGGRQAQFGAKIVF